MCFILAAMNVLWAIIGGRVFPIVFVVCTWIILMHQYLIISREYIHNRNDSGSADLSSSLTVREFLMLHYNLEGNSG